MIEEPIKITLSQEQMRNCALNWMRSNYQDEKRSEPTEYYAKVGLLIDFVDSVFGDEITRNPPWPPCPKVLA